MLTVSLKLEQTDDGKALKITDLTDYTGYDINSITDVEFTILNLYDNRNVTIASPKQPIGNAVVQIDSFDLGFTSEAAKDILPDAVYITKLTFTITKNDATTEDATSQDTVITYYLLSCSISGKAGVMAVGDDCCDTPDVYKYFTARMYKEAAIDLHSCALYNKAQYMLNRGNKLINFVNCGNTIYTRVH